MSRKSHYAVGINVSKTCIMEQTIQMYRKPSNVLFNDAPNTFYLRLYGVGHIVKDYSVSERGNPLLSHGLLFPVSSKSSFICIISHTGQDIPRALIHQSWRTGWNEKKLNGSTMMDRSENPSHHERTLLPRSYMDESRSAGRLRRLAL